MAGIHVLPLCPHSADQITHLWADLAAAQEHGVDLGSRAAHIQANGGTLLAMKRELERAFGRLRQELALLGLQDPRAEAVLLRLLVEVEKLADAAQRFSTGP